MRKIKLTDLISVDALQQIQDGFSRYTGMAALTTDVNGTPVTTGSGFTKFCMELTRQSEKGCHNCEECDKNGALLTLKNGHASVYTCHAGLMDFAAPIMVEGNFIGSFIGGQVRTGLIDKEKMRQRALKYGIDPEEYIAAAEETAQMTQQELQEAADFLEEIAESISSLAYRNYLALQESKKMENAAKSQTKFVMGMTTNIERSMMKWFEIVQNTIDTTDNEEIRELLSQMQAEGEESRSNIRDIIDYVRMSAKRVEIEETEYKVSDLVKQIEKGINEYAARKMVKINTSIDESVPEVLFGDAGRIGQLVNKIIRILINHKKEGSISVKLEAYRQSYATILSIIVLDENASLPEDDRKVLRANAKDNETENVSGEDDRRLGITLARLLRRNMSGKFRFEEIGDKVVMTIDLPQLSVGGNS